MEDWRSQKLLDMYILDYMIKNNMRDTAAIFAKEADVCLEPVALKCREGYLAQWWGFFSDVYSNRVSKHPDEGSSTHGLQDSFPYNFQATQINAENYSQNMNPTMEMPGLQDSFPNICQATQTAGNWSEDFLLNSPWPDMYDLLQNPSPTMGLPELPNHPRTVHSTAMPSPDMEDSQQSTPTTTISGPGMVNLLQSGLPTTTPRPDLNPNYFGSPSSLDTDVVEGDPLNSPWRDMYDLLQNPSPTMGFPELPNHPQTVHSTAMPSPDMEDSQQSTLTTTISGPGMVNLLQSGLPTTTPRPDLNPNYFGPPSSLDTDVVEGDLLNTPWRDMYDLLQNPSPTMGLPELPNHPQTVHSTAMPSPDMEDSQQSTLKTTISGPGMVNLLQSGLPTTTPRPDLNPNDFGSPSSLDTDVVEGDLSPKPDSYK